MKNYIVEISTNGMDWENLICDYTQAESALEAMSLFLDWYKDQIISYSAYAPEPEETELADDVLIRAVEQGEVRECYTVAEVRDKMKGATV